MSRMTASGTPYRTRLHRGSRDTLTRMSAVDPPAGLLDAERRLDALRAFGSEAVSFQSLESHMRWWYDDGPDGTRGAVAYVDTGRSWIAAGSPLASDDDRGATIARFVTAARAARRRPVFFGVETPSAFPGARRLALGLQPELPADGWHGTLRASRRLREQVRRARAKGVVVREVGPDDLAEGTPLRARVDQLAALWLGSRHLEPMGFLVAVEPFHEPGEHVYLVAERDGRALEFLSAVPIYARGGWLVEDVLRAPDAPNGTTELVIDALMRRLGGTGAWITPGLTPLTGRIPIWMRAARFAAVALYDFVGLHRFRARLSPPVWKPVWLVWDTGPAMPVVLDVLRAFANGRIVSFAARSLLRHPSGPPWAVALPLVPWTALLALLTVTGRASLLGFSHVALGRWVVFDAVLAWLLFAAARRPRLRWLVALSAGAAFDAIVSIVHLARVGAGSTWLAVALRTAATTGPLIGTAALVWATSRARAVARARQRARADSAQAAAR